MPFLFKVKGPRGVAALSLDDSCSFLDLQNALEDKLEGLESYEDGTSNYDIMVGFPPKPFNLQPHEKIEGQLQWHEAIRVQLKELSGKQAQGKGPMTGPKKKRQRVLVSSSSSSAIASSPSPTPKSSSSTSLGGFGPRIATIAGSSTSKSTNKVVPQNRLVPFGNRIASLNTKSASSSTFSFGSRVGSTRGGSSSSSSGRKKQTVRRVSAQDSASSEADISTHLMESVSGGTGKRNKVLRDVFRKAVEHQYNSAKALARLHAVYSGNYQIEENANVRTLGNDGQVKQIDVKFHRGTGSRTFHEETVDLLPDDTLLALLKLALEDQEGMGREVLKPMNLSKCSPRMFWSLVYSHGQNLIHTITTMLQGIDNCEWLTERKRELSEKAKENERQQKAKENERQQKAKEEEQRIRREQRNNKKRPASETIEESQKTKEGEKADEDEDDNVLVSPLDTKEVFLSSLNKALAKLTFEQEELQWLQVLPFIDIVPDNQYEVLVTTIESDSMLLLALSSSKELYTVLSAVDETLSCEQVETWIESAQHAVLQYMWHAICGYGCERLRLAFKKLRIRSPKDIVLAWKNSSVGLFNGLLKLDPALAHTQCRWRPFPSNGSTISHSSTSANSNTNVCGVLTEDCVKWMIQLCTKIISDLSFAKQYAEVIVDDEQEEEEVGGSEHKNDEEEEWTTDPAANPLLGKRCRVIVRDLFAIPPKEEEEKENDVLAFWEDGIVHSYLPPTTEEPMALWKVLLDASPSPPAIKIPIAPRYEDLEENEVTMAIKRLETCNFQHI